MTEKINFNDREGLKEAMLMGRFGRFTVSSAEQAEQILNEMTGVRSKPSAPVLDENSLTDKSLLSALPSVSQHMPAKSWVLEVSSHEARTAAA